MDDVVTYRDLEMNQFIHQRHKSRTEYTERFWDMGLRYRKVYSKYVLKRIFIACLTESICKSLRFVWYSENSAAIYILGLQTTSTVKFQNDSFSTRALRHSDNIDS